MSETLNQKVVNWANGQIGKQVGAGECWDLANSALKQAGAGTSSDYGPTGADDDYIWGTEIADLKDAIPGDILQYRDYPMKTTTKTEVTFSDGSGWNDNSSVEITHAHHPKNGSCETPKNPFVLMYRSMNGFFGITHWVRSEIPPTLLYIRANGISDRVTAVFRIIPRSSRSIRAMAA